MKVDELIERFAPIKRRIRDEFDVAELHVFGSVAREEDGPDSDIDILVGFKSSPTFARFMDLKFFLEDMLELKVDLVTRNALRQSMKRAIEAEAKRVA